jgi:hypothetical protein
MPYALTMNRQSDPPFKWYDFLNCWTYDVQACLPVAPDRRLIHLRSVADVDAAGHTLFRF